MKKNIIFNLVYQILLLFTPLITTPYLSRILEPYGIGTASFTMSVQAYFTMFAVLGTAGYGIRQIAMLRDDRYERSKMFWEIEILVVFTTTIALSFWGVFIYLSEDCSIYYAILSLGILAVIFDISWFYSGIEDFKSIVLKNSVVKIVSVILIFAIVKTKEDLWIYILILSLSTLIGNLSLWVNLKQFVDKVSLHELHPWRHFAPAFEYFIPSIAISVYLVLDKVLIGVLTNSAFQNGFYEQAHKIVGVAKVLTFSSINSVLGSRISYLFSEKRFDEIKVHIAKSIDLILLIGICITFGIISVADIFVPLFFGKGYDQVGILLSSLCPIVIFAGISSCVGSQYFTPFGLLRIANKLIIAGAFVNLLLNLALIPRYSAFGAVLGTVVAEAIIAFLFVKFDNGYLTYEQIYQKSIKKIIAAMIMLGVIRTLTPYLLISWASFLTLVGIGSLAYVGILVILKDSGLYLIFKLIADKLRKNI